MHEQAKPIKPTIPEAPELPPVFNKKTLYFYLFPNTRGGYQSWRLRRHFFDRITMQRVGIDPAEYPRIRFFSPVQCSRIRRILAEQ